MTARADAISERKFSFLEAKLKAEAEAAVEEVEAPPEESDAEAA